MNDIKLDEEAIYHVARSIGTPEARESYLQQVCRDDTALRDRLEALLRVCDQEASFLEVSPYDATGDAPAPIELPGTVIGPYKLMEQIGEGGMGVVYVAEQREPVRRKVALKVIKPGMDTRQVIARFEAERQALAMMDHPNIAKVFDAGATPPCEGGVRGGGRPYFVMELVQGLPITEYCDGERLSIRERLELFVLVCRAVQHAHQKGIIHRDLKPSNILVTLHDGVPVPKVIDFGVAKATGQALTDKTAYTAFTQLIGTPLYMSPEQVELSGLDIDTRSDIYSLGVLLYELLTGTTPFDSETLRLAALDEMRRMIREDEPPTPSTRLNTLGATLTSTSAKRSSDPRRLNRAVRGELDWIAMKALEKDRKRRYETANDFAADVMRYLTDQPVEACPPSAWYRFMKFARRNRVALTTAALLTAMLVLGTVMSTWQAMRATRAERDAVAAWAQESQAAQKAKQSQANTQAFSDFLVDDVLAVARPKGVQGGLGVGVTVAQALEAAEANLAKRFAGRPLAEATARDAIGKTWRNLAKYEQAERHLRRAVELRERELGPDDPATLDSRNSLGVLLAQAGRYGEAIALHEETLKRRKATLGVDHRDTLTSMNGLATAYSEAGQLDQALPLHEETLKQQQMKLGPNDPETLLSMSNLAFAYRAAGKSDQALPLLEVALERMKATLGPDHPHTLVSMNNLADVYQATGKLAQALQLFEQVLEKEKAKSGPNHLNTLRSMHNLAFAYQAAGKTDRALPLFEETLEKLKATLGPDHPHTLQCMDNLARSYQADGKLDQAVQLREQTLKMRKAKLGPDHLDTLHSMNHLAFVYQDAGKLAQALPLLEDRLEKVKAKLGPDHPDTLQSMNNLASAYWSAKKLERSVPLFGELLKKAQARLGSDHPHTLSVMANLGANYRDAGRLPEGIALLERAWEMAQKRPGPLAESLAWIPTTLGQAYDEAGRFAEAEPLYREALERVRERQGEASIQAADVLDGMGQHLLKQQKYVDGEKLLRECLTIREQKTPDDWKTSNAKSMLGASLLGQKKYADAEPLLLAGYEGLKQREETIPPQRKIPLTEAIEGLVQLYEETGKKDKAAEWRMKRPVTKSAHNKIRVPDADLPADAFAWP